MELVNKAEAFYRLGIGAMCRQLCWFLAITVWWVVVETSLLWSVTGNICWVFLLGIAVCAAFLAARGGTRLGLVAAYVAMAGAGGWILSSIHPRWPFFNLWPISVYIGTMVVWMVWRVSKCHHLFGPLGWQLVAMHLGMITVNFFSGGIGVYDPSRALTQVAFNGVWDTIVAISGVLFMIDVVRASIISGPFLLEEIEAQQRTMEIHAANRKVTLSRGHNNADEAADDRSQNGSIPKPDH